MARPRRKWNKADLKIVYQLIAENRFTIEIVASYFKMSAKQFYHYMLTNEKLQETVECAQTAQIGYVANRLMDIIDNPNNPKHFASVQFYLRTKGGWRSADSIAKDTQGGVENNELAISEEDKENLKKYIKLATLNGVNVEEKAA